MSRRKALQPCIRRSRVWSGWVQLGAAFLAIMPLTSAPAPAPAQRVNGESVADACTSCHGIGGRSQGYIPSIAGADKAKLLRQLKAFRAQAPEATIMNRIARAYTDPELDALAGYFSAAPRP